jgi:hypothetical protein
MAAWRADLLMVMWTWAWGERTGGSFEEAESRRTEEAAAANEEEASSPWLTPGAKNQGGVMEVLTHRMRVLAAAEDEHDRREERLDEHLDVQVSVE